MQGGPSITRAERGTTVVPLSQVCVLYWVVILGVRQMDIFTACAPLPPASSPTPPDGRLVAAGTARGIPCSRAFRLVAPISACFPFHHPPLAHTIQNLDLPLCQQNMGVGAPTPFPFPPPCRSQLSHCTMGRSSPALGSISPLLPLSPPWWGSEERRAARPVTAAIASACGRPCGPPRPVWRSLVLEHACYLCYHASPSPPAHRPGGASEERRASTP